MEGGGLNKHLAANRVRFGCPMLDTQCLMSTRACSCFLPLTVSARHGGSLSKSWYGSNCTQLCSNCTQLCSNYAQLHSDHALRWLFAHLTSHLCVNSFLRMPYVRSLSVCLSICLFVCRSVCLSVCLSLSLSAPPSLLFSEVYVCTCTWMNVMPSRGVHLSSKARRSKSGSIPCCCRTRTMWR